MIKQINHFKNWFEQRTTRERILIYLLSVAAIYAFFYLLFYRSLDYQTEELIKQNRELKNQAINWQKQINVILQISRTSLYKEWLLQKEAFEKIQKGYRNTIGLAKNEPWEDVFKTILRSYPNVKLLQVRNLPEAVFNFPGLKENFSQELYHQILIFVVESDYVDTIHYLQQLEKSLPNIRWNSMDYQVMQYPIAKVEMEFSVLYDKNS